MKQLLSIVSLMLAINFLALAGGVGWLYQSGHLDRARVSAIKEVLFPPPPPEAPASTQPAASDATTQPVIHLEELLARHSGHSAAEQVEYIRQAFDAQAAQLDLRHRALLDLMAQVDLAKKELSDGRAALEADRRKLAAEQQEAQRLAADKGFQDSLALYTAMPAKQAKGVFMTLPDDVVVEYLQAMQPRTATKIIREFKAPEENDRIQRILEKIRQSQPPSTQPAAAGIDKAPASGTAE